MGPSIKGVPLDEPPAQAGNQKSFTLHTVLGPGVGSGPGQPGASPLGGLLEMLRTIQARRCQEPSPPPNGEPPGKGVNGVPTEQHGGLSSGGTTPTCCQHSSRWVRSKTYPERELKGETNLKPDPYSYEVTLPEPQGASGQSWAPGCWVLTMLGMDWRVGLCLCEAES